MPVLPAFDVITTTTSVAKAAGDTLSFAIPAGMVVGDYLTTGGVLGVRALQSQHTGLTVTLGSTLDVTYPSGKATIPAGSVVSLRVNRKGSGESIPYLTVAAGTPSTTTTVDQTGTFSQTLLNNDIATLATKMNLILRTLKEAGIIALP